MQCKRCAGRGKEWYDDEMYGPCRDCHGFGIVHCCEGEAAPTGPDIEPPLKGSKANREVIIIKKDPPPTGYEMTYAQAAPHPLVKVITEIILKEVSEKRTIQ